MAIIVSSKLVEQNKNYGRTINHLMEIFINKEMEKRGIRDFQAAIGEIFDDGKPPKIHFNKEATFVLTFKNKKLDQNLVGQKMTVDLKEIEKIEWREETLDKDSAKFFIFKWNKNYWVLDFDFRYNKAMAKEKIERAKEFLNASRKLNVNDFLNVLIYNLWSCAELITDAKLFLIAQLSKNTTEHEERKKQLRKFRKTSNIFSDEFCDYFLKLSSDKNNARYGYMLKNKFTETFISKMMGVLKKELDDIKL